jgi:hypothetical protein
LALRVGCTFGLESAQPAVAIMQVAPRPQPELSIGAERWETGAQHHCYVDHYGNRCERFELAAGATTITYEADVSLARAADVIARGAAETPGAVAARRGAHLRHAQPVLPARRAGP